MSKKVDIKFQYFFVKKTDSDGNYDLTKWLEKVADKTIEDRVKEFSGITGRLEDLRDKDDIYGLLFMRMDDLSNTYKVKKTKVAEHIDLDIDEYLGKSTVALYDPDKHILMIEKNRGGFSYNSIESYICLDMFNGERNIKLQPIYTGNNINTKIINKKIRKIEIRLTSLPSVYNIDNNKNFSKIINALKQYGCYTATLTFGIGRGRLDKSLDKETIIETISELKDNRSSVSSARVQLTDDEKSELIDIFDDLEHEYIRFEIPQRGEINFDDMLMKMAERYKENLRPRIR